MSPPAHILALVTDAWGGRGGIAQYNRDFLGALAGSGDVASITVLPRNAVDRASPPDGVRQLAARHGRVGYSAAALRTAMAGPVDVVFCGHLYMAPLARLIAILRKARLVIQAHGIEAWPRPKASQRRALEAADLVLAVSRHTRAAILDWAAIAPERIVVVPNTVSDAFSPGDAGALRSRWDLDGKTVVLTVGRMDAGERYKGHDRVIAALPALSADIVYAVVGEGDDRPRLQALARELGVEARVRFLGAQPDAVRLDAYRMADLFAMPSTGEGFGIVFLEAMACGTPALGLAVAGARDALADGDLGVVANADDLAGSIAGALKARRRGTALARAVQARFGREPFEQAARDVVPRMLSAA